MRKIIVSLLLGSVMLSTAQETTISDALRYATNNLTGTARFRGMSGAVGAVGGDMSALTVNPAGSAFFNNNYASVSVSSYNAKNNSNYFGTKTKETFSTLDLNQIGGVFVFNDNSGNSGWSKIVLGMNYENTNDFDNRFFSAGVNPNNSIDSYFLNKAQGLPNEYVILEPGESITGLYSYLGQTNGLGFSAQQAMLAFQGFLIDSDGPGSYYSNVPTGGNYYQDNYVTTSGYNGKMAFNFATSYQDKLFLGINLNAHFTDFKKSSSVYESNNNPLYATGLTATAFQFDNELYTYGTGFSMNLGVIYQFTEGFRSGISYESPTWYRLNDELAQRLIVLTTDGVNDYRDVIAPNVINVYETYKLQTPSKWTFSNAYIFGEKGLLSVDYSTKDYSNTKFKPSNDNLYGSLNTQMGSQLKNASELRIGGEYKIKQWSVRGGYRFEESPYENDFVMGDLTGYSTGVGYNFGESKLDLAYANDHRNYNMALISSGMNDAARIRTTNNNVTLTYSINF